MAEQDDVIPGSSPGSDSPPNPDAPAAGGVTPVASETERPIENLKGEFDRKMTKVERQLAEIAAGLAALTTRPAPEPTPAPEYSDQQLLELANAGNAAAHQEYVRRMVAQQVGQQRQIDQQQHAVTAQLQNLYGRYPQLTDASHPLTQAALQAKAALVRNGYAPQSAATDLEAIKLAIVDNPGLAQPVAPGPVPSVGSGRTPQQGIDGATSRRPAASPTPARTLSQKEREIAGRMGVKDPEHSRERFMKRQQDGRSALSPLVAQIVREETP